MPLYALLVSCPHRKKKAVELDEATHVLGLLSTSEPGLATTTHTRDAARVVFDHLSASSVQGEASDLQELLTDADELMSSWDRKGSWSADSPVGMVMRLSAALRRVLQTPTDDEREALANLIPLDLIHDRDREGAPQNTFEAADRIPAAGFRRTLAGKPPETQALAVAQVLHETLNLCDDDKGCRCEEAGARALSIARSVLHAAGVVPAQGEPEGAEVAYFTSLHGCYAEESSTLAEAERVRREASGSIPVNERTITKKVTYWVPVQAPGGERD